MSAEEHTVGEAWLHAEHAHNRIKRHDDMFDRLMNRPSRWEAATTSFLTMALGSTLTVIIILIMFGLEKH